MLKKQPEHFLWGKSGVLLAIAQFIKVTDCKTQSQKIIRDDLILLYLQMGNWKFSSVQVHINKPT